MRVLITGANGFIGQNLRARLSTQSGMEAVAFTRSDDRSKLSELVDQCDAVVHLAGENRPATPDRFEEVNVGLTADLVAALRRSAKQVPLLLASSAQATKDNPYGRSKQRAESIVQEYALACSRPAAIYRLPGVFGKWARPNYNSVVATFCHNIAHDLPIRVDDPDARFDLVYVDDVIDEFLATLAAPWLGCVHKDVQPRYSVTVGELASQIRHFHQTRPELHIDRVGTGFTRALYATYVSYLPRSAQTFELKQYADPRGVFVEFLKTSDSGQFSFFTSGPGITRGGHFHDTKTEKFLVVKGEATFRFRHVLTGESYAVSVSGKTPTIVQTVPGWAHDITNDGSDELIALLWANEVFDRARPDTFTAKV